MLERHDIRLKYDGIKTILEDFYSKGGDRPEEIYHRCRMDNAAYYGNEDGFVIVTTTVDENTLDKELFIWVMYADVSGFIEREREFLIELARSLSCKKIAFGTQRKGFGRLLGPGWKCRNIEHEMEIE